MLDNLVLETANNPGTSTNVSLLGAATGRRSFIAAFGNGATCFYFMEDGTQSEAGIATLTAGSPNILARTTVLWDSSNGASTPSKRNFTGTVRLYCSLPAGQAVYLNSAGRLGVGTTAPLTVAHVNGGMLVGGDDSGESAIYTGSTSATAAFVLAVSAASLSTPRDLLLQHTLGGRVYSFEGIANNTTASAANVRVDPVGGQLLQSTSSGEFKTDVEDLDDSIALRVADALRPVWHRSICEADPAGHSYYGLIAEEVAAIDPRLASWRALPAGQAPKPGVPTHRQVVREWVATGTDARGVPTQELQEREADMVPVSVQYDRALLVARRGDELRLAARVAALEARLAALEAG